MGEELRSLLRMHFVATLGLIALGAAMTALVMIMRTISPEAFTPGMETTFARSAMMIALATKWLSIIESVFLIVVSLLIIRSGEPLVKWSFPVLLPVIAAGAYGVLPFLPQALLAVASAMMFLAGLAATWRLLGLRKRHLKTYRR